MFNCYSIAAAALLVLGQADAIAVKGAANNNDPAVALLERLCNAHAPSGFEDPVRSILRQEWGPLLQDVRTDGMGNLIGDFPSKEREEKPRVLVLAHMDEVGLIVSEITEDGFLFADPLGDWLDLVLPAQEWAIMTRQGPVIGYSGVESVHITASEESGKSIRRRDLFIDIGARTKEEVLAAGIRVGSPITPNQSLEKMLGGKRYLAKALDDRAGLSIITEALKRLQGKELPCMLIVAATVQEEPGMRGAQVLYPSIHPDIIFNLDISAPRDFPAYFAKKRNQPRLGGGPSLFVYDGSMIPSQRLVQYVIDVAEKKSIPLQFDSVEEYGQDGSCLQRSGKGASVVNLGIPVRYPHSHAGVMDREDFDKTVDLLVELLRSLDRKTASAITSFAD